MSGKKKHCNHDKCKSKVVKCVCPPVVVPGPPPPTFAASFDFVFPIPETENKFPIEKYRAKRMGNQKNPEKVRRPKELRKMAEKAFKLYNDKKHVKSEPEGKLSFFFASFTDNGRVTNNGATIDPSDPSGETLLVKHDMTGYMDYQFNLDTSNFDPEGSPLYLHGFVVNGSVFLPYFRSEAAQIIGIEPPEAFHSDENQLLLSLKAGDTLQIWFVSPEDNILPFIDLDLSRAFNLKG